jgi:hypothetical protein
MAHKRAPNTLVVMKTEGSLIIAARVFSNLAKSSQLWPWVHQKWWVAKKKAVGCRHMAIQKLYRVFGRAVR